MNKRFYQLVGIVLISIPVLLCCEKEKKETAPSLPPMSAFVIDAGEFAQAKSTQTINNFGIAVLAVSYWNSVLYGALAVPVAAYIEAFKHEAVRLDNTTWKWSYEVEGIDATYTAELFAEVAGDSVNLEMHVSKSDGFQDFVWFTGTCDVVRTGGYWTVYNNPESNLAWLDIDWNHDWAAQTFDVRYTNILEGNDYQGSYIEYGITDDPIFNAYYEIYNSLDDKDFLIELNTTTHSGRVTFDGIPHCWDNNLQDVECTF
jgi:hypothetical protein